MGSTTPEAPNFDLTSVDGPVLMLKDEAARGAVVLYLFPGGDSTRVREELSSLSVWSGRLRALQARLLGLSPGSLPRLRALAAELDLRFPLLSDDRGFAQRYGVLREEDSEGEARALVLVDRRCQIRWRRDLDEPAARYFEGIERELAGLPRPSLSYPGAVVHPLVDWWVNR